MEKDLQLLYPQYCSHFFWLHSQKNCTGSRTPRDASLIPLGHSGDRAQSPVISSVWSWNSCVILENSRDMSACVTQSCRIPNSAHQSYSNSSLSAQLIPQQFFSGVLPWEMPFPDTFFQFLSHIQGICASLISHFLIARVVARWGCMQSQIVKTCAVGDENWNFIHQRKRTENTPPSLLFDIPPSCLTSPKEWCKFQIPKEILVTPQGCRKIGISFWSNSHSPVASCSSRLVQWDGPHLEKRSKSELREQRSELKDEKLSGRIQMCTGRRN